VLWAFMARALSPSTYSMSTDNVYNSRQHKYHGNRPPFELQPTDPRSSVHRFIQPIQLTTLALQHEAHPPLPRSHERCSRSPCPCPRRRPRGLLHHRSPPRCVPRGARHLQAPVQQQLVQPAHRRHRLPPDQRHLRSRHLAGRQRWRLRLRRPSVLQPDRQPCRRHQPARHPGCNVPRQRRWLLGWW
jgi:hypothetical protein